MPLKKNFLEHARLAALLIFVSLFLASAPAFASLDRHGEGGLSARRRESAISLTGVREASRMDALSYFRQGNENYSLKDNEEAIRDYGMAIALDPGFAEAYLNRALAYHALGDFVRAIVDYSRAIALNPSALAYYNRGRAYNDSGNKYQAMRDLKRAVALSPELAGSSFGKAAVRSVATE